MAHFNIENCLLTSFELEKFLKAVRPILPSQNPLRNFIHHNPLHAFEHYDFFDGVIWASVLLGSKPLMNAAYYSEQIEKGTLQRSKVEEAILQLPLTEDEKDRIRESIEKLPLIKVPRSPLIERKLRSIRTGVNIDLAIRPLLIRSLSFFLDQGISEVGFVSRESGYLSFFREHFVEVALGGSAFLGKETIALKDLSKEDLISRCLNLLEISPEDYNCYLLEVLLSLPGWAGMCSVVEEKPEHILFPRSIGLSDFLAVFLWIEASFLLKKYPKDTIKVNYRPHEIVAKFKVNFEQLRKDYLPYYVLQTALENTFIFQFFDALLLNAPDLNQIEDRPTFQAVFCIDDRECSLRRHLEGEDPRVKTYGTAGFFGLDILVQSEGNPFYIQHCPIVIKPKIIVKEVKSELSASRSSEFLVRETYSINQSLWAGLISTHWEGIKSSLRLFFEIFKPSAEPTVTSSLNHLPQSSQVEYRFAEGAPEGLQFGFSIQEMSSRVRSVLRAIDLTCDFAPIVAIVAHGASSANNPYFSAYDCGACSGKPGSINAKIFAAMANHPEVRAELKGHSIEIPEATYFVAGIHDTTRDEVLLFDTDLIPASHQHWAKELMKSFERALKKNAQERARKFELVPLGVSEDKALKSVQLRSTSIFEPRPELNHATNCLCVIGSRQVTEEIFLDRRSFLQSYNYRKDLDGQILLSLLSAAVPVCGGINLEYFFSRVDPQVYGAGSKLPHNVAGLIGVLNGTESDLRVGLPTQMTEFHDPLRLMILVEGTPDILEKVLKQSQAIHDFFFFEWGSLSVFSPESKEIRVYQKDNWKLYQTESSATVVENPEKLYRVTRDPLPPFRIRRGNP